MRKLFVSGLEDLNQYPMHDNRNWLVVLVLCVITAGCGGGDTGDNLPLSPVSGTVRVDGKPLDGITLSFVPSDATTKGQGGVATSDAEGNFSVFYRDGRPGLPEGTYSILATRMQLPDGSRLGEGQMATDVGAENGLPERYAFQESTNLFATVSSGDNPHLDIEITSSRR